MGEPRSLAGNRKRAKSPGISLCVLCDWCFTARHQRCQSMETLIGQEGGLAMWGHDQPQRGILEQKESGNM